MFVCASDKDNVKMLLVIDCGDATFDGRPPCDVMRVDCV